LALALRVDGVAVSAPTPIAIGQRVRSNNDGQIGFIVERPAEDGGGLGVRLDRRAENIVLPYSAHKWRPDEDGRLTPLHVARIAYEADRVLMECRGTYGTKEWKTLPEAKRIGWMRGAPEEVTKDKDRARLYEAVVKGLK
jgi:hypothetical protein